MRQFWARIAKAGNVDHIQPVRLPKQYLSKYQGINSDYVWSLPSGEKWSGSPAFPLIVYE
jgi:hypothetical protein